jgi:hypothetical protein
LTTFEIFTAGYTFLAIVASLAVMPFYNALMEDLREVLAALVSVAGIIAGVYLIGAGVSMVASGWESPLLSGDSRAVAHGGRHTVTANVVLLLWPYVLAGWGVLVAGVSGFLLWSSVDLRLARQGRRT